MRLRGPMLPFVAALLLAPEALQAQEETRTTLDGVFTAEQAARGKAVYQESCVQCHALDWYKGDVVRAWEGAPLYNLFDVISTRMPEDNPGSLDRREYVDMLAYILELNGMPPGEQPLSTGSSRLRAILFKWKEGS